MRWRMLAWISLAQLGALSLWFSATAVLPSLHTPWMSGAARAWISMAVTLGFVAGGPGHPRRVERRQDGRSGEPEGQSA